jgi:cation transport ATPase
MPENYSHGEESCSACATDVLKEKEPLWKQKAVVIISVAGAFFLIGVFLDAGLSQHVLAQITFLAATLFAGYSIIKKGLLAVIRKHQLDMNLLMTSLPQGHSRSATARRVQQ